MPPLSRPIVFLTDFGLGNTVAGIVWLINEQPGRFDDAHARASAARATAESAGRQGGERSELRR
jgi:hypothetical protein